MYLLKQGRPLDGVNSSNEMIQEHRVVKGRRFKNSHLLLGQNQNAENKKSLEVSTQGKIS